MPPEDRELDSKMSAGDNDWPPEEDSAFHDEGGETPAAAPALYGPPMPIGFLGLIVANLNSLLGDLPPYLQQFHTLSSEEIVKNSRPAIVKIRAFDSTPGSMAASPRQGTGFNIDARGLIITNRHVLDNCQEVRIDFADGRSFTSNQIKPVGDLDLALVQLDARDLPVLAPDYSRLPAAGELLTIVGDPQGYQGIPVQGSLAGYAAGEDDGFRVMVIQANIAPGNSGSPVLDKQGRVAGVVFAMTVQGENSAALAIPLAGLADQLQWPSF